MTEFQEYRAMKSRGLSPTQVYRAAQAAGVTDIDAIRMLRSLFGLSLAEAKEVVVVGSGTAQTLREHEEAIAQEIRKALESP